MKFRLKLQLLAVCLLLLSIQIYGQPKITSFSPGVGPVGSSVTITGSNFSTVAANNIVFFGGVKADVTSATANSLTVTVPSGATYKPISITTSNSTAYSALPFVTTFAGSQNLSPKSFSSPIDSTVGLYPYGVVVADFDGDGKPDIATPDNANSPSSSVTLLRNTGSAGSVSFSSKTVLASNDLPYSIASADIDGDGKADLIVTNNGNATLSIYRNTSIPGTISFQSHIDFSTGDGPFYVAVNDIDGDGKPDVAVANYLSASISVFKNTTVGTSISFASKVDFTTGLGPRSVVLSDFDSDGKPDLAVANELSNSISYLRNTSNTGSISFTAKTDISVSGNNPFGLAAGDLNNDSKPDLALVNESSYNLMLFRNASTTGSISFSNPLTYNTSYRNPYHVVFSDISGDGKPDLVVSCHDSYNSILLFQNYTISGSNYPSVGSGQEIQGRSPYNLDIADVNGDGKPEILSANFVSDKVSIYQNRTGEPTISSLSPSSGGPGTVVYIYGENFTGVTNVAFGGVPAESFTVVNAGYMTAVIGATGASGDVTVFYANGSDSHTGFTFTGPPIVDSFSPKAAAPGQDVNIYGKNFNSVTSVAFGGVPTPYYFVKSSSWITATVKAGSSSGNVSVTTQYGTGSLGGFELAVPTISSFSPQAGPAGTVITITGNFLNKVDSVSIGGTPAKSFTINSPTSITATVGGGSSGKIYVFSSDGADSSGYFTFTMPAPPTITSFAPLTQKPGSVIVITGNNFNTVASKNLVTFGARKTYASSATSTQLTVTVLAGATYDRVTVLNTETNLSASTLKPFIPTFSGTGIISTSSFPANPLSFNTGTYSYPWSTGVSDLDGDGKSDILTSSGYDELVAFRNTGGYPINFDPPKALTGLGATWFAIQDMDGDGKPEILGSPQNNLFWISRNISAPGIISFEAPYVTTLGSMTKIGVADFDGDGRPDIALPGNQGTVTFLRNTCTPGNISFTISGSYPLQGLLTDLQLADFDNDGKMDIAATIYDSTLAIFKNISSAGNFLFTPGGTYTIPEKPQNITICDLDSDGKPDIVAGKDYDTAFVILRNTTTAGTLSFAPQQNFYTTGSINDISVGDVDGDAIPDLVVAEGWSNSGTVSLYKNSSVPGNIILGRPVRMGQGEAYIADLADLDGDSRPELINTITNWDRIDVYKNQTPFTLPLTLLSFTATNDRNTAHLSWVTAKEVNTSHFKIEHSIDGREFREIGDVKAIGTGNETTNKYTFSHLTPVEGFNYYRLKMIDNDGMFSYSKIVSADFASVNSFSVYPNPATDVITITHPTVASSAVLRIVNAEGKMVKTMVSAGARQTSMMIKDLPKGVYTIVFEQNSRQYTERFVVK